jgi:hypothetical protein
LFIHPAVDFTGGMFVFPILFSKHVKKHARSMLENTLGDGDWLNWCLDWQSNQPPPIKETEMNTTLNQNRSFNLFLVAGFAITLIVLASLKISSSATPQTGAIPNVQQAVTDNQREVAIVPMSADAFRQYRQSEWHSGAMPVTGISGLETYQQSERMLIPAQAGLMEYQLSERTLVEPLAEYLASERTLSPIVNADLSVYHLSERTMTEAVLVNNFAEYFASERTLVDPQAGLATYFDSERTSIPVSFTTYQLSEWFGK